MARILGLLLALWPALATARGDFLGVAYQTWNKPLGVWQTAEQLEWDLTRMRAMGVRSLRVEWVWNELEPRPGQLDFSRPDLMVRLCRKLGIRLLPIIGFQWPPSWIGAEHHLGYQPRVRGGPAEPSPIMSYTDPYVLDRLARIIRAVTRRYRGDSTIAAWVLGNEFAYVDYESQRQLGYDGESLAAFRRDLAARFGTPETVARRWGRPLASFAAVTADELRIDGAHDVLRPAVRDFLDFRRRALASAVATACRASREGDAGMPRTYSAVGVLFSQYDEHVTSEDWGEIARRCRAVGAPLSYFSLNSYLMLHSHEPPNLGTSAAAARALTSAETDPARDVSFTEFGNTSTEIYLAVGEDRQGPLIVHQVIEGLFDGLEKMHVFTWNDKPYVSERERGFGIAREHREAKPALAEVARLEERLAQLDVERWRKSLRPRAAKVALLLPDGEGMAQWNSWYNETWEIAGYFTRLDLPFELVQPQELAKSRASLLVLSRQSLASLATLERVQSWLVAGKNVLAVSGVPGVDRGEPAEKWRRAIADIFGLEFDAAHIETPKNTNLHLTFCCADGQSANLGTWLLHAPRRLLAGTEPSTQQLELESGGRLPFYFRKRHGAAQAIYIPFAIGYVFSAAGVPASSFMIGALRDLLRPLGLTPVLENLRVGESRILTARRRPLDRGGDAVFVQSWPGWDAGGLGRCGEAEAAVELRARAGESWVRLMNGQTVTAGADGVARIALRSCQADLLIPRSRATDLLGAAPAALAPPGEAARRAAFPPRVFLDGTGCLSEQLQRLGYQRAELGIGHSANYDRWWTEPARGYYSPPRAQLALDAFGVLMFDGTPPPNEDEAARWLRFLDDPSHRMVVHTSSAEAGWARFQQRKNVWIVSGECSRVDSERLRELLERP